jgi:hypothetical protein
VAQQLEVELLAEAARVLAQNPAAPANATVAAVAAVEAVAEAAEAAQPPSLDATAVFWGGEIAPGLDRHRCQSLVGAAIPVWASTSLEPEAVEHPCSGVQN